MKSVAILLSTYNGEKYLKEQLDSLINQTYENITIIVRDDGSIDGTKEILKSYSEKKLIKSIFGKNIGCVQSFFELVKYAEGYDYYSFCDQDDVWLGNKIEAQVKAVELLEKDGLGPVMQFCGRTSVDEVLKNLRIAEPEPTFDTRQVALRSEAAGNVMLFNAILRDRLLKTLPTTRITGHDCYFYRVALCIGRVGYDKNSYVLYRQHGNNVAGPTQEGLKLLWGKIKKLRVLFQKHEDRRNEAKAICENFWNEMGEDARDVYGFLAMPDSWQKRLAFFVSRKFTYPSRVYGLGLKVLTLIRGI